MTDMERFAQQAADRLVDNDEYPAASSSEYVRVRRADLILVLARLNTLSPHYLAGCHNAMTKLRRALTDNSEAT